MLCMSRLDRFEQLAQRLVEGTFVRFFQPRKASATPQPLKKERTQTKEALRLATGSQRASRWTLHIESRRLSLGEPVINIGRALDNDVILDDSTVSRHHAQLRWRQGQYFIYPPDSSLRDSETQPCHILRLIKIN